MSTCEVAHEPAERPLNASQVDDLSHVVPEQYVGLVYVLASRGLGWAETIGLKTKHVNLLRRRVDVHETLSEVGGRFHTVPPKTWEARTVAIPPFVADVLGNHMGRFADAGSESPVITTGGTPLRSPNFRRRVWYPAVAQIGREGLRIHDMRHTCASMLIAAGAHPELLREHLSHNAGPLAPGGHLCSGAEWRLLQGTRWFSHQVPRQDLMDLGSWKGFSRA